MRAYAPDDSVIWDVANNGKSIHLYTFKVNYNFLSAFAPSETLDARVSG